MAHIKDLHLNILQNVLAYFCHGTTDYYILQEFRLLLPPAAVCRVWRECMLPYVYERAYLEYHIKETDEDNETAHPIYEWKSNIDLIVSQRLSSAIKYIRIKSFECPLNITDMVDALNAFGFSSSHWGAVNALYISTNHDSDVGSDSAPSSNDDETLAAQLTDCFGRHLPNIGNLSIYTIPPSVATRLLSNSLVNLYIRQLHWLYCYPAPITFECHSFSSTLRQLTVCIAPGVTNRLPQLLASPLENLTLFDIPHNFAWWTFVGIAPGHIEFTNLRKLWLQFEQPSENAESSDSGRQACTSAVSLNIGHRKLFFPKLKELRIYHSPYDDEALYSMLVHSPLETVDIDSSFKSVQHMDPRILLNAATVHFNIHSVSPDDYIDYGGFWCKLLSTPSNAQTARLGVYQSSVPLPIPSTIEWISLEHLILETNVHLASVIQAITRLPKLHTLRVENVVDEVNEAGASLQAILTGTSTQMQSIATNVSSLSIYSDHRLPLVFSLDVMQYLAILVRSLDEVAVPDMYVSDIKEFANHHANAFPHLRSIRVRSVF